MSGNCREARAAPTRRRFLGASAAAAAGFLTRPAPLAAAATLGVSPVASYPTEFPLPPRRRSGLLRSRRRLGDQHVAEGAKEGLAAAQETLRLSQERKEFGIAQRRRPVVGRRFARPLGR